jgi:hypothetical protein
MRAPVVENLGKRMPKEKFREELEALHIYVQCHATCIETTGSGRRAGLSLTPHFSVSVARRADVAKVPCLTNLWRLRIKVETYDAPKEPLQ